MPETQQHSEDVLHINDENNVVKCWAVDTVNRQQGVGLGLLTEPKELD